MADVTFLLVRCGGDLTPTMTMQAAEAACPPRYE
jgi:hypothetical protein